MQPPHGYGPPGSPPPPYNPYGGYPGGHQGAPNTGPYGQPYYGAGQAQHPSAPPYAYTPVARKKTSPAVIAFAILGSLLVTAFYGARFYLDYQASTPEGKAHAAAERAERRRTVLAASDALALVGASLPRDGADVPTTCPAGTKARHAPRVDSVFLSSLAPRNGAPLETDTIRALEDVRGYRFPSDLASDVDVVRRDANGDVGFGTKSKLEGTLEEAILVVLAVDAITLPKVDGDAYELGEVDGRVIVFDRAHNRTLCQSPIHAESSETVKYGGGVRLKVRGIPTPAVGKKGLGEAVSKDFAKNVSAAMDAALTKMGG